MLAPVEDLVYKVKELRSLHYTLSLRNICKLYHFVRKTI